MTEIKACFTIVLVIIGVSICLMINSYEKEIAEKNKEIKLQRETIKALKINNKTEEYKKIIEEQKEKIETLEQNKQWLINQIEIGENCQRDGISPSENGYIIDGYYYELKGEASDELIWGESN